MASSLQFLADPVRPDADTLIIIGRGARLLASDVRALLPALPAGVWEDMVKRGDPGDNGRSASTFTGGTPRKVVVGVLPEVCSRHNSANRAWAIPGLVRAAGGLSNAAIVFALDDATHAYAAGLCVARVVPTYATSSRGADPRVAVSFVAPPGSAPVDVDRIRIGAEAVRFAAQLVDAPPNQLTTTSFVETARHVAGRLPGVEIEVTAGDELLTQGFGGLWNVGKASPHAPAFVVLDYSPAGAARRMAWVGKGITYDTGGLSLKAKTSMPGMKSDMAGAAAVLASFAAAVQLELPVRLTAALCIAENAIGPTAMRPDDIIQLYSGKTVEVNNTDAEGRLVLADGVAWVVRHRSPDEVIDLATLTGAQLIATGKRHAGLYCSTNELEARAVQAGRASGELVHPLPFAPELFRGEFHSAVADMKNSVKDRNNAQSSCAAQFLLNHMGDFGGAWAHVDMVGPATTASGRGTGFGVGLLLTLAGGGA